jgi:FKBP-type peptidyl-prolyl cis-trans isomerase
MKQFISLLLLISIISCNKDDSPENLNQTEADIIQYIEDNNLDAQRTPSGAYYIIDEQGIGDEPEADAYVKVIYKGYLLDGSVFDSSTSEGYSFDLLSVIPGFAEGITYFNKGAKGSIIIPPSLAYGSTGFKDVIPGGAVVIFDIEIVSIMNAQDEDDILEYLVENELEAEKTDSGLYYIIDVPGEGADITQNSIATVKYTGTFINGVQFDASADAGAQFNLQNVIPGFAEGLKLFKVGGKGTLIIPPSLAYGSEGVSDRIPRNAVLIFEIEILDVN